MKINIELTPESPTAEYVPKTGHFSEMPKVGEMIRYIFESDDTIFMQTAIIINKIYHMQEPFYADTILLIKLIGPAEAI